MILGIITQNDQVFHNIPGLPFGTDPEQHNVRQNNAGLLNTAIRKNRGQADRVVRMVENFRLRLPKIPGIFERQ